jgi:hypothetical protein
MNIIRNIILVALFVYSMQYFALAASKCSIFSGAYHECSSDKIGL